MDITWWMECGKTTACIEINSTHRKLKYIQSDENNIFTIVDSKAISRSTFLLLSRKKKFSKVDAHRSIWLEHISVLKKPQNFWGCCIYRVNLLNAKSIQRISIYCIVFILWEMSKFRHWLKFNEFYFKKI